MTRGSITGQVKALSIIVAMENFIPDRRAVAAEKKSAPPPVNAQVYQSAWLRNQQAATTDPQPTAAPTQEEAEPTCPEPASSSVADAPPDPAPSEPALADRVPLGDGRPPYVPLFPPVTGTKVGFSIRKNPFARPR